jgi:hypothetical protein
MRRAALGTIGWHRPFRDVEPAPKEVTQNGQSGHSRFTRDYLTQARNIELRARKPCEKQNENHEDDEPNGCKASVGGGLAKAAM